MTATSCTSHLINALSILLVGSFINKLKNNAFDGSRYFLTCQQVPYPSLLPQWLMTACNVLSRRRWPRRNSSCAWPPERAILYTGDIASSSSVNCIAPYTKSCQYEHTGKSSASKLIIKDFPHLRKSRINVNWLAVLKLTPLTFYSVVHWIEWNTTRHVFFDVMLWQHCVKVQADG